MENSNLITKAIDYVNHNYGGPISVDDVALNAGFSSDYFNRIFFNHTGFTVMEYVRFRRLKNGARRLRTTDKNILDIALGCGYDSHESFTRAFKKQYGLTPAEYRKKYEQKESVYGEFFNDTLGERIVREFTDFKIADTNEVIDYLLEKNAVKYGYIAVCFHINGGSAVYQGKDFRDGFIWFTEWEGRAYRYEGEIICDDPKITADYLNIFSDERFSMILYTLDTDEVIKKNLSDNGCIIKDLERIYTNVYTGEPYKLSPPAGFSMRLLHYDDYSLVEEFYKRRFPDRVTNSPRLIHLKQELYNRDIKGMEHSVFMFGIFRDNELVGTSDGAIQQVHGFKVNNCIVTYLLSEYESEDIYQFAFKYVTNEALERGALPIDDIQTPWTTWTKEGRCGAFNSTDLGYRTATCPCIIK